MTIFYKDEETGIHAGIDDMGQLFIYIRPHTIWYFKDGAKNRNRIAKMFVLNTGKSLEYGMKWYERKNGGL